jgi:hypothetical protein
MIIGLNTAPVGMWPYPKCTACQDLTADPACAPRYRIYRDDGVEAVLSVGADIMMYNQKDAVDAQCLDCRGQQFTCVDATFDTARLLVYAFEGNVYARIAGGRNGQIVDIAASAVLTSGKEVPLNKRIIIER